MVEMNGKYGYIGTTGTMVIEPTFAAADSFSEGLAAAQGEGGYGYIDKTGTFVIEPQFYWGYRFSEGRAVVSVLEDGVELRGYIDKTGKVVVEPRFSTAGPFSGGLAYVQRGEGEDLEYIDASGAVIWSGED